MSPKFLHREHILDAQKRLLVDVMNPRQKVTFRHLCLIWLFSVSIFWGWWIQPQHMVSISGMIINSVILAWSTLMPGYYFYFVSRMKRPSPTLEIPQGLRVAMVVTKVPSEPFSVIQRTLEAMIAQEYPHDNWLADEDPSDETLDWCRSNNVYVSSRKGISEYHRNSWPRRTKTKEGNLAYFYDFYGYDSYDIVAQLDADHIPDSNYLNEILRPFSDTTVGYVSAPSICDLNCKTSWAARARLYAESTMHGSLQAGYNDGWAPLCIGSHYAVRTRALKEIGGLGPELAEDHSTTFLMNAHGWKGVHALDAIAHGDGPATFADCMVQEFQWSRSLANILFTVTPKYWSKLTMHLKFQFIFSQLWYPLFGIAMLVSYLLPIYAILLKTPWMNISYLSFLAFSTPVVIITVLIVMWIRRLQVLRPVDAKIISWEIVLFQLTRWPWVLWGTISAVVDSITRKNFEFKVTPKGTSAMNSLPIKTLAPYVVLSVLAAVVAILQTNPGNAEGYYYFLIIASVTYATTLMTIILRNMYETQRKSFSHTS